MNISTRLLYGNTVTQNTPPTQTGGVVKLPGVYAGKPSDFALDADALSKHTMLIGGTGCGKTTLFYHFVSQIKRAMTQDDVMIIFGSKGDFYSKFYEPKTDLVIGNSKQYLSQSAHWNIYKEILADGWDERDFIINTQEICKSFFFERTQNTTNTFFPNAARDLLAAIIIAFIRAGIADESRKRKYFYNNELKMFLDLSDRHLLIDFLKTRPDTAAIISYIANDSPQSQGVISEMYSIYGSGLGHLAAIARKPPMSMLIRAI